MSSDPNVEAARQRIQRLVEEIGALSKAELPSEEFFQKFLERVVAASDGKGGALWLVGAKSADGKSEFQLAAQVEFDSGMFRHDETQRAAVLKIMSEVMQQKRALILPAEIPATPQNPVPVSTPNRTPYPFVHVPLFLQQQPLGVLQVWLQPYVTPENYGEFATFLGSLAGYVEQHFQARRLGNLVLETQRLQQLLRFAADIAGSLDSAEIARYAANYGRDLVGCERAAVLWRKNGQWEVISISGQEVVERKSAMVKAMTAFVRVHSRAETQVLSKRELLARAEAARLPVESDDEGKARALALNGSSTDTIDLSYFELSHVVSAVICPLHDAEKQLAGAFFCESTAEGFFENPAGKTEPPAARRVAEWLAVHTGKAIAAARDHETLPFLGVTRHLRATRLALTGDHRRRNRLRFAAGLALTALLLLWPVKNKVDGQCTLNAVHRAAVVAEVPALVKRVLVREGEHVKKGQPLAELDSRRLESELAVVLNERLRFVGEAERYRAAGDEASAQAYLRQAEAASATETRIRADIESMTLRSPLDGVIMTKDLELRVGEVMQPGALLAEVNGFDAWELQVELNEKDIGTVERELQTRGSLPANFILYAQSRHVLRSALAEQQQISAVAVPRDKDNVFLVTFRELQIPDEMRKDLRPGLTGLAKIEMGRHVAAAWLGKKIYRWFQFGWLSRFFDWLFY